MVSNGMLLQLLLVGLVLATTAAPAATSQYSKPGCPDRCGNVSIPYPFGTKEGCYLNESFLITCNHSLNPPKPFFRTTDWEVTSISLNGQLRILQLIGRLCSNPKDTQLNSPPQDWALSKFFISNTHNKFFAIGCDTSAGITGFRDGDYYSTECKLFCDTINYEDESCSGNGCCEMAIPKRLWGISMTLSNTSSGHSDTWGSNSCSYAFVVEKKEFKFSADYVHKLRSKDKLPLVLDWAVGKETSCQIAQRNQTTYACRGNSTTECRENHNGYGYRCQCREGYHGNPYLHDCQDIDECESSSLNQCVQKAQCVNGVGNYFCHCPKGYHGDGRRRGNGCVANSNPLKAIQVALGVCISVIVLLLGSSWSYWGLKRRKLTKLREKFFQQNGGLMLQQQLSKHEGSVEGGAKIFTAEELKKATNNYHESRVIGRGGHGTVYKGILPDNTTVAIKKSKIGDESQVQKFINELVVLSRINHRNVVKLLGFCLETQVPLLVFEFVTNGTLFEHIHNECHSIPWETRLRIATETAGALSYLHSAASTPIIHRDVKTTNILLDDNYIAKVSDFGASKLIPLDKSQITTLVQGTLGYLDPEYFHTSQLTEKSDVYSFGVVLVELLTGKMALSFKRPEEDRNLATYFISSLKEDCLSEILDNQVLNEENLDQLKEVAMLAERCLSVKREERPTMKEVAMELEELKAMKKQDVTKAGETKVVLDELSDTFSASIGSNVAKYDTIRKQVLLAFDDGR